MNTFVKITVAVVVVFCLSGCVAALEDDIEFSCIVDGDCPGGHTCVSDRCIDEKKCSVPGNCECDIYGDDCPNGMTCVERNGGEFCYPSDYCESAADCWTYEGCDEAAHTCKADWCDDDDDCDRNGSGKVCDLDAEKCITPA